MTKKLLALLIALSMLFSVCSVSVFAEETGDETGSSAVVNEEDTTAPSENEEPEYENSIEIEFELEGTTVTVTSDEADDDVYVLLLCDGDVVSEDDATAKVFKNTGVKLTFKEIDDETEYRILVFDKDEYKDEEEEAPILAEESFTIEYVYEEALAEARQDIDGNGTVTVWIEGLAKRIIDETVVSLSALGSNKQNVFELAEYILEDADIDYKDDNKKITMIESSTYRDNRSSSSALEACIWGVFINGVVIYEQDWTSIDIEEGDEVIFYFGVPGTVGYPDVEIDPEEFVYKDDVTITVEKTVVDLLGNEVVEPAEKAKIYFVKRGATSLGTAKTTDEDGEYDFEVTSTFISSYQGGEIVVTGYVSSTKPITMVSVAKDILAERDGTVQAWVRIEGAHKTLLERTKSDKIDEYDLYNFAIEVFEEENIEYEENDDENNFIYLESKTTSGYSNMNGQLDGAWHVVVNDEVYGPDDNLEDVPVYSNDEILFYFGDENTVPIVYTKVDGDLKVGKKVYVYFYSNAEMTIPIEDMDVYFDGGSYNEKRLTTNSNGRVQIPTITKSGEYELLWGEQVGVRDDFCPDAVFGSLELDFTGSSTSGTGSSSGDDDDDDDKYECAYCNKSVTKLYEVDYKGIELDVCSTCRTKLQNLADEDEDKDDEDEDDDEEGWDIDEDDEDEDEDEDDKEITDWDDGDYRIPVYGDDDFVPGPSKYYPDTNIDAWAVEGVNKAREYELMSGTTYGYFEPQRGITRAEFTTIISRMLGLDTNVNNYAQKFNDVKKSDWYFGSVMAAQEAGYINGMSDTTFAPNEYITREEIAVLVSRIINRKGAEADVYKFTDGASVSAWARVYVVGVSEANIITGDQFGQFLPKATVNRQTAATIAVRLYEYLGLAQ